MTISISRVDERRPDYMTKAIVRITYGPVTAQVEEDLSGLTAARQAFDYVIESMNKEYANGKYPE